MTHSPPRMVIRTNLVFFLRIGVPLPWNPCSLLYIHNSPPSRPTSRHSHFLFLTTALIRPALYIPHLSPASSLSTCMYTWRVVVSINPVHMDRTNAHERCIIFLAPNLPLFSFYPVIFFLELCKPLHFLFFSTCNEPHP